MTRGGSLLKTASMGTISHSLPIVNDVSKAPVCIEAGSPIAHAGLDLPR